MPFTGWDQVTREAVAEGKTVVERAIRHVATVAAERQTQNSQARLDKQTDPELSQKSNSSALSLRSATRSCPIASTPIHDE